MLLFFLMLKSACQVIGHSLGGGTAALLTYILRERKEFSSSTCVTFAPGMSSEFLLLVVLAFHNHLFMEMR